MMIRKNKESTKRMQKHFQKRKVFKRFALLCVAVFTVIISLSNDGMKAVKAAETEIGRATGSVSGANIAEIVTYEMIRYDDGSDQGTYTIRYYLEHSGAYYAEQVVAVGIYVDGVHVATFDSKVGNRVVNGKELFGSKDIVLKAGTKHLVELKDLATGGTTVVNMKENIYLPYRNFDVTYKDFNNTVLKTQTVEKYSSASAPSDPSRTGYTFAGWSRNSSNITSNTTITAQYNINYYTVRYLDHNGSVLKTQSVPYTSNATSPSNPSRTGYTFTGWNDSGANITANRDITAQYRINNYTIAFNSMGGSTIPSQSIQYQAKVSIPTVPTRANYKFMGWYTDALYRTPYNFDTLIGANAFTLYAKWDAYPVINASNITFHDTEYNFDEWQTLKMKGVTSSDAEDGNMTSKIKITKDTVNLDVPGVYAVNYQVSDSAGTTINKEVKVTVVFNNPPEIEFANYEFYEDEITIEDWKKDYLMKEVKVSDMEDGNITSKVVVESDNVNPNTPGEYQVVYRVTDQFKKTTRVIAKVKIKYNYAPLITAKDRRYIQSEFAGDDWKNHIMDNVEAIDVEDGNITINIKVIEDDVDIDTVGFYRVKYEIVDNYGKKHTKSIKVEVVLNTPPIIHTQNKSFYEDELTADEWNVEILKDVTSYDSEDGDITSNIKIEKDNVDLSTAGSYEVSYKIVDSSGKETIKTIDVTIKKNHEPALNIYAENKRFVEGQYTIEEWSTKVRLENVSASDIEDNNLTDKIVVIEDTVKTDKAGIYSVIYKVTDKFGKNASKAIKVTVEENLAPVIHASERWFSLGDVIDNKTLLKNVIAYDDVDGEISDKVVVKDNTIDITSAGDYTVTYTVMDSLGKSSIYTIPVHIKKPSTNPLPPVDPPVQPSDENAVVFANGKKYGKVELSKIMENSDYMDMPYDSVAFGIYAAKDVISNSVVVLEKDSLISLITLDEKQNGVGTVYHAGYYYVKEISVDDQYVLPYDQKFYFRFEY